MGYDWPGALPRLVDSERLARETPATGTDGGERE